jgi:undecaprenyl-diphosphatase
MLVISDYIPGGKKTPKKTTYPNAIFIGICQGIATLPGLSRSGTTITAGILCGLRRDFVVKYSFIMSIPAILGACVLDIGDMHKDIVKTGVECYIAGVIAAAIIGYICIKTMLVMVKKKQFRYFAVYCGIIGMIAIVASFIIK